MWIRGHTLDLLILSILNDTDTPPSMTGYSIAKEMEKLFEPFPSPSPGTIYPRLKKLEEGEFIRLTDDKNYVITPKGKTTLDTSTTDILNKAYNAWNILYKSLLGNMNAPFSFQFKDYHDDFFGFNLQALRSCCQTSQLKQRSTEELERLKTHMERTKQEIQEKTSDILVQIDNNLTTLTDQIEAREKQRIRPQIEWTDSWD